MKFYNLKAAFHLLLVELVEFLIEQWGQKNIPHSLHQPTQILLGDRVIAANHHIQQNEFPFSLPARRF